MTGFLLISLTPLPLLSVSCHLYPLPNILLPSTLFMKRFILRPPPLPLALLFAIAVTDNVRGFLIVRSRPISHFSQCSNKEVKLQSSKTTDSTKDLWNADISPSQHEQHKWASSLLSLPEHADNPSMANRARYAMSTNGNT